MTVVLRSASEELVKFLEETEGLIWSLTMGSGVEIKGTLESDFKPPVVGKLQLFNENKSVLVQIELDKFKDVKEVVYPTGEIIGFCLSDGNQKFGIFKKEDRAA